MLVSVAAAEAIPNLLLISEDCSLHQLHLVFLCGVKPFQIMNPMYSIYTQMNLAQNYLKIINAAERALQPDKIRILFTEPPDGLDESPGRTRLVVVLVVAVVHRRWRLRARAAARADRPELAPCCP